MTQLDELRGYLSEREDKFVEIASNIWSYAEISYTETKSEQALVQALKDEGFDIIEGIAEIPTAFKASFKNGTGKPVIGFLAEYDALDGLSQEAANPEKAPVVEGGCGHGCGHNLLGTGSLAAAVAVKQYLVNNKKDGTVVLFGCPAEEGAGSKQFIARAGYFDDVDFVYCWHPGTLNEVQNNGDIAIMGANFIFDGVAAHAGGSPHLGRSALDSCELMNVGVNYLREHMIDQARIHYAYSDAGGTAPNVVQSHACIKYEVRAPKVEQMKELFARVVDVAKGAALMAGTKMHYDITMAFSDFVQNKTLAQVMDQCLKECGAPQWNEEDSELALKFMHSFPKDVARMAKEGLSPYFADDEKLEEAFRFGLDRDVHPYDPNNFRYESGSTDVGDVGYATPTANLLIATACLGCVGHSWQNTALAGSVIGMKGMMKAAEVMALAAVRTMDDEDLIKKAKEELKKKNGGQYSCPLPEYVKPPIGTY